MSTNCDLIMEQCKQPKLTPWCTSTEQYTCLERLYDSTASPARSGLREGHYS